MGMSRGGTMTKSFLVLFFPRKWKWFFSHCKLSCYWYYVTISLFGDKVWIGCILYLILNFVVFLAVKFGRMSKKQKQKVEDEVRQQINFNHEDRLNSSPASDDSYSAVDLIEGYGSDTLSDRLMFCRLLFALPFSAFVQRGFYVWRKNSQLSSAHQLTVGNSSSATTGYTLLSPFATSSFVNHQQQVANTSAFNNSNSFEKRLKLESTANAEAALKDNISLGNRLSSSASLSISMQLFVNRPIFSQDILYDSIISIVNYSAFNYCYTYL